MTRIESGQSRKPLSIIDRIRTIEAVADPIRRAGGLAYLGAIAHTILLPDVYPMTPAIKEKALQARAFAESAVRLHPDTADSDFFRTSYRGRLNYWLFNLIERRDNFVSLIEREAFVYPKGMELDREGERHYVLLELFEDIKETQPGEQLRGYVADALSAWKPSAETSQYGYHLIHLADYMHIPRGREILYKLFENPNTEGLTGDDGFGLIIPIRNYILHRMLGFLSEEPIEPKEFWTSKLEDERYYEFAYRALIIIGERAEVFEAFPAFVALAEQTGEGRRYPYRLEYVLNQLWKRHLSHAGGEEANPESVQLFRNSLDRLTPAQAQILKITLKEVGYPTRKGRREDFIASMLDAVALK